MLPATNVRAEPGETVILLHGLGRSPWSFWRLQQVLRSDSYQVVNVAYPSRQQTIEDLSRDYLAPVIAAQSSASRLHFVTHSLGGIMLRCYLREHPVPGLGRVVMLAPSNAGSELADRLKPNRLYRAINGPAGQQLETDGMPRALGPWPAGAQAWNLAQSGRRHAAAGSRHPAVEPAGGRGAALAQAEG